MACLKIYADFPRNYELFVNSDISKFIESMLLMHKT